MSGCSLREFINIKVEGQSIRAPQSSLIRNQKFFIFAIIGHGLSLEALVAEAHRYDANILLSIPCRAFYFLHLLKQPGQGDLEKTQTNKLMFYCTNSRHAHLLQKMLFMLCSHILA